MKKKLLIILIVIILLFPNYTKADHGSPSTILYKGIVTKKSGLKCDGDYTISYGSIIEVEETYNIGEIPMLKFYYKGDDCGWDITYNDFELYNKNFNITDYNTEQTPLSKFENSLDVMVVADKGIKLYKGPAKIYDTITTIPNKTKLYAKYYIDDEEGMPWLYVTYKGKSGWIFNVEYDTVYGYSDEKVIITFNDAKDEVKCNTIVNGYYLNGMIGERNYYIKYNDKMYFVYGIGFQTNETIKLKKDVKLEETLKEGSKVIETIKKGTTLKAEYASGDNYSNYYYVTYNGKKGWIVISNEDDEEIIDSEITDDELDNNLSSDDIVNNYKQNINIENITLSSSEIKTNERLDINIKINNNSNTNVEKILLIFKNQNNEDKSVYINDINTKPYIKIENSDFDDDEYTLENIELEMNDENKTKLLYSVNDIKNKSNYKLNITNEKNSNVEDNNTEETKKKIEEIHKINNKHLYIGIGSAISITITSIIFIILINKRRKEKTN